MVEETSPPWCCHYWGWHNCRCISAAGDNCGQESLLQLLGESLGRREAVFRIASGICLLERQYPERDRVALAASTAPKDAVAGDWLVEQGAQEVVAEMSVRL